MDPERRAPREPRTVRFEAHGGPSAEVVDLSAVGMRVKVSQDLALQSVFSGVLHFDETRRAEVKVRVVWSNAAAQGHLVGLEIVEAGKDFFDALPSFGT